MDASLGYSANGRTIPDTQTQGVERIDQFPAESTTKASSVSTSDEASPLVKPNHAATHPAHQRFVFTDPVAFRLVFLVLCVMITLIDR